MDIYGICVWLWLAVKNTGCDTKAWVTLSLRAGVIHPKTDELQATSELVGWLFSVQHSTCAQVQVRIRHRPEGGGQRKTTQWNRKIATTLLHIHKFFYWGHTIACSRPRPYQLRGGQGASQQWEETHSEFSFTPLEATCEWMNECRGLCCTVYDMKPFLRLVARPGEGEEGARFGTRRYHSSVKCEPRRHCWFHQSPRWCSNPVLRHLFLGALKHDAF